MGDRAEPVRLVRKEAPEGARWLFSRSTVGRIDGWYETLGDQWVRQHLPDWLLRMGPFEFLRWQWLALPVLLGLRVYWDFAGYTDIAVGTAALLGWRVPENFDRPYLSRNLVEFWRRWHITLSSWFRDYVFYPLEFSGRRGNRFRQRRNVLLLVKDGHDHGIFDSVGGFGHFASSARSKATD